VDTADESKITLNV
jgi:hypothetical protein